MSWTNGKLSRILKEEEKKGLAILEEEISKERPIPKTNGKEEQMVAIAIAKMNGMEAKVIKEYRKVMK